MAFIRLTFYSNLPPLPCGLLFLPSLLSFFLSLSSLPLLYSPVPSCISFFFFTPIPFYLSKYFIITSFAFYYFLFPLSSILSSFPLSSDSYPLLIRHLLSLLYLSTLLQQLSFFSHLLHIPLLLFLTPISFSTYSNSLIVHYNFPSFIFLPFPFFHSLLSHLSLPYRQILIHRHFLLPSLLLCSSPILSYFVSYLFYFWQQYFSSSFSFPLLHEFPLLLLGSGKNQTWDSWHMQSSAIRCLIRFLK